MLSPPPGEGEGAGAAMSREELREWHESFLPSAVTPHGERRLVCSYNGILFHGFAAWLTEDELAVVATKPGFRRRWVFPDGVWHPETTRTPAFLGLTNHPAQVWSQSRKGVIIGVLDSGLNPDQHPSFDDAGMPPPPPRWKGRCIGIRCNNKVIGAKSMLKDGKHAAPYDDYDGHGSLVASAAAGNFVANASYLNRGQAAGTAAGMAPGAHLAIYQVCDGHKCDPWVILYGFQEAIAGEVDIINVSLGFTSRETTPGYSYLADPVSVGAFKAMSNNILVVTAAGNVGPLQSTVKNDSPWQFTVGSGSLDRRIGADVVLGSGATVHGEAVLQGAGTSYPLRLVCPTDCRDAGTESVVGRIVVCNSADHDEDGMAAVAQRLYNKGHGAVFVVVVAEEASGHALALANYGVPAVQVTAADGRRIREYYEFVPDPEAEVLFTGTKVGVELEAAPMLSSFSGRGPSRVNPRIMKPDILAPGLNILAAAGVGHSFVFQSGTSMAAPHITGLALWSRASVHPNLSPAGIRSSMMTTASHLDNHGNFIMQERGFPSSLFDMGAGQVVPRSTINPGLVYDIEPGEYAAYMCHLLGHEKMLLQDINVNCAYFPTGGIRDIDLNYPSLLVPRNTTVRRTLTRVGTWPQGAEVYRADFYMEDSSVQVNVVPKELCFNHVGDKLPFNVSVDYQGKKMPVEGFLYWKSDYHTVSSPIFVVI